MTIDQLEREASRLHNLAKDTILKSGILRCVDDVIGDSQEVTTSLGYDVRVYYAVSKHNQNPSSNPTRELTIAVGGVTMLNIRYSTNRIDHVFVFHEGEWMDRFKKLAIDFKIAQLNHRINDLSPLGEP